MELFYFVFVMFIMVVGAAVMMNFMGGRRHGLNTTAVIIMISGLVFIGYATLTGAGLTDTIFGTGKILSIAPESPLPPPPTPEPVLREHPYDCEVVGGYSYIEYKSRSSGCGDLEQRGNEWVTWCEC